MKIAALNFLEIALHSVKLPSYGADSLAILCASDEILIRLKRIIRPNDRRTVERKRIRELHDESKYKDLRIKI